MAELRVNPRDLVRVADAYTELAARAALISPQAAVEVQRVADTHGPIGYPTAVGIAGGLATPESALKAKVADFTTYAQRFAEHAATYTNEDTHGARRMGDVSFPHARGGSKSALGASSFETVAHGGIATGGGAVIVWCVPIPTGFRCTNLFSDGRYNIYPSPTDRTGAWLP